MLEKKIQTTMDPEKAKQIAKCIVEALTDAGLQIVPVTKE
jgi:hypothetical protein